MTRADDIYTVLLARIEAGEEPPYRPGNSIPAASTLALEFDVSKGTIAKVTKRLKDAGYIVQAPNGSPPLVRKRYEKAPS